MKYRSIKIWIISIIFPVSFVYFYYYYNSCSSNIVGFTVKKCDFDFFNRSTFSEIKDKNDLPIAYIYYRGKFSNSNTIIFRVPGGPGNPTHKPFNRKSAYVKILDEVSERCNAPIFSLAYDGTAPRQSWPRHGFSSARNQVSNMLAELKKRNPEKKIIILGESLGGYLIALSNIDFEKYDIFMFDPKIVSRKEFSEKYKKSSFTMDQANLHYVDIENNGNRKWINVNKSKISDAFFEEEFSDLYFFDFLNRNKKYNRMHVFYNPNELFSGDFENSFREYGINSKQYPNIDHQLALGSKYRDEVVRDMTNAILKSCGVES